MTNNQVVMKLSTGYRMNAPPRCPNIMYDIMRDCWKEEARSRPTFETLQWKLEGYFDTDLTSYDEASRYWARGCAAQMQILHFDAVQLGAKAKIFRAMPKMFGIVL